MRPPTGWSFSSKVDTDPASDVHYSLTSGAGVASGTIAATHAGTTITGEYVLVFPSESSEQADPWFGVAGLGIDDLVVILLQLLV
jgi:hypothetical protein